MSIQRIDNPRKRTHGWQARAYLESPIRQRPVRLTRFFSDSAYGGVDAAYVMAVLAETTLTRQAARLRQEIS